MLESVRKNSDSKMYFFGIAALDRFKTRLKDYPQYCQHLSMIPHFKEFPAHLVEWVEFGAQSKVPPTAPQGPVVPPAFDKPPQPAQPQQLPNQPQAIGSGAPGQQPPGAVGAPSSKANLPNAPGSTASSGSTPSSSTIVRPTVSSIGGRPSIANTTNIDTLLNAKQKSGPQVTPF